MPLYELEYSETYQHYFTVRVEAENEEELDEDFLAGKLSYRLVSQQSFACENPKIDWDSVKVIRE